MHLATLKKSLLLLAFSLTLAFNTYAHHGELGEHVRNNILYYGPALILLIAIGYWITRIIRKAKAN